MLLFREIVTKKTFLVLKFVGFFTDMLNCCVYLLTITIHFLTPKTYCCIADAVQSIAPPLFNGRGYEFSVASGLATTTASSTEPTHVMPAYDWSQPSSSYALMPPSDEHTESQWQDKARREPDILNQQMGSGDDHMSEEREHKSEEKSKKEL